MKVSNSWLSGSDCAGKFAMTGDLTPDYVRARWAYSELLSIVQGHKYQGPGVPELREKARQGVPFEALDQEDCNLLLDRWHAARGVDIFTQALAGISEFQLAHWKRDDLVAVLVIPHFVRDIVSESIATAVQVPFGAWIETEPVRPLHQWHARYAAISPPSPQTDPITVGRIGEKFFLLDGYHRAVAFWNRIDPDSQLLAYVPIKP
jgi:hypothetical protein